jgi:Zn-dependent protease with chaperone function
VTGGAILAGSAAVAGYAAAAGLGAPAVLGRRWSRRSPRVAMCLWLALAVSWVAAVALAGLVLATPAWSASLGRPGIGHGPLPGGTMAAGAGLLLAVVVIAWASWHVARGLGRLRREHRQHAAFLLAAGRPDHALGAVIVDDDIPAAYCLPYGRPCVVVSSAAVAVLRSSQLQAVLAHERAHLRGRHHLAVAVAAGLARAFPAVPLLRRAGAEVAVLAEMAADDAAARRHDRGDLAAALVVLATASVRAAALTAGGPAAVARVRRLLAPVRAPRRAARIGGLAASSAALAAAAVIACLPVLVIACDAAGVL